MIRGGRFYAIWDESKQAWTTNEYDAIKLIDNELYAYADKRSHNIDGAIKIKCLKHASTKSIDKWKKYTTQQAIDNYLNLNETIIFSNMKPKKEDYSSIKLDYQKYAIQL